MTESVATAIPSQPYATESSREYVQQIIAEAQSLNPHQPEFLQTISEILPSLAAVLDRHPEYREAALLERIVEPERALLFRVPWMDDYGVVHVQRGFRVGFSSAIGPYKGGLRFHPSVNLSVLKFLGFEQIFKNSLTGLPIGGGKGGSDFDPKGRSDAEVMRFCQAFMSELFRYIGPDTDIPAGDIGVGAREIGYLFGMYKKLTNEFTGVFTGKGLEWGGSLIRTEATGYGCVFFAVDMLETRQDTIEGKRCIISGSGNVAQYAAEKIIELGGIVLTLSDSSGFIHDPDGIDREKLSWVMDLKNDRRGRIGEYVTEFPGATFSARTADDTNPIWTIESDCAFPCATQNEIKAQDARNLINAGITVVCEGANMPTDPGGQLEFIEAGILYGPGKAANAGGVAVSALEMAQNSQRIAWTREGVETQLRGIMRSIHDTCVDAANEYGTPGNYFNGANIAGFVKVANAMIDQGLI